MQIRRAKKIIVLFVIVVLAVLLSACGQVDFTYKQNRDGTYFKEITITIDEEGSVSAYGYSIDSAMTALKIGFEKNGYCVTIEEKSIKAQKVYDTLDELKESELSNGIVVEGGNYADSENAFLSQRTIYGEFKLSNDYIDTRKIEISAILMDGGITSYTKAQEIASALLNTRRTYTYITPYKSTSSNANSITKDDNGYYVHTWNDISNNAPVITTTEIKGAMWYGVAIIISVVVLVIVVVTKIIKENKSK